VVAVSGGADSLALLHLLLALRNEFGLTLHVATFDHQIRGEQGAEDVRFVQEIAAAWGVPCTAGYANVPELAQQNRLGLEETARQSRYAFLTEVAAKVGARQIATGHNQDDQAETVLMRVIRGAGLAGLRGMLPGAPLSSNSAITLVRPLLDIPRAEIDAYLRDLNIQARTDITNADTSYIRNRLRHEVIPLLENINPQVRAALARTAEIAREDYDALESSLPPLTSVEDGFSIDRSAFLRLPVSQQRLLIRQAVAGLLPGEQASFERVQAAIELAQMGLSHQRIELIGRVWFGIDGSNVHIGAGDPQSALLAKGWPHLKAGTQLIIDQPGIFDLPGDDSDMWQLRVERIDKQPFQPEEDDPLCVVLAIEPGAALGLRTRQIGDRFRPLGMKGHSRKIKEVLIDMKVPARWRSCIPLLTVNNEISWFVAPTPDGVHSYIAQGVAVRPDETRAIWRFTYMQAARATTIS